VQKQVSALLMHGLLKCDNWEAFMADGTDGDDGILGTNSLQKLGCTTARLMGLTQEEVEVRGHLKEYVEGFSLVVFG
jgi:hypothetical protein